MEPQTLGRRRVYHLSHPSTPSTLSFLLRKLWSCSNYSFLPAFNKYLLNIYSVTGIVLGVGWRRWRKQSLSLFLRTGKKKKVCTLQKKKKKTHNPSIETGNKSGGKHLDGLAFKQRLKPGEDTEKNIPDRRKGWNKGSKKWKEGMRFQKQSPYSSLEVQTWIYGHLLDVSIWISDSISK